MKDSHILEHHQRDGYVVLPGLFRSEEVNHLGEHYRHLRAQGSFAGDSAGLDVKSDDPLKRYPGMIHMHRWDATTLQWLIAEGTSIGQIATLSSGIH